MHYSYSIVVSVCPEIEPGLRTGAGDCARGASDYEFIDHTGHPYLISLQYDDQLGGAIRSFVQLANTTVHWNRRPVEPFVVAAHCVGVPSPSDMLSSFL